MTNNPIGDALKFDPLAEAEKQTGNSYKDDPNTMTLGFIGSIVHNQRKVELLKTSGDTHYGQTFEEHLNTLNALGLEEVLRLNFEGSYGQETEVFLWSEDGLFARVESFAWENESRLSLNTSRVMYNYRHPDGYPAGLTSSGGMHGDVWIGDHDAREGIVYNITQMREQGDFLNPWVAYDTWHILNYMESRLGGFSIADMDTRDALREQKLDLLPDHIRKALGPKRR